MVARRRSRKGTRRRPPKACAQRPPPVSSDPRHPCTITDRIRHSLGPKQDRLAHVKSRYSSKSNAAKQLDILSACESSQEDELVGTDLSAPTSADEDNATDATAPMPQDTIMYSFDSARGPSSGSQILSTVVDRAVERFQDQETTQLVRDEYELVDGDGESIKPKSKKGKRSARRSAAREDAEYEFI